MTEIDIVAIRRAADRGDPIPPATVLALLDHLDAMEDGAALYRREIEDQRQYIHDLHLRILTLAEALERGGDVRGAAQAVTRFVAGIDRDMPL